MIFLFSEAVILGDPFSLIMMQHLFLDVSSQEPTNIERTELFFIVFSIVNFLHDWFIIIFNFTKRILARKIFSRILLSVVLGRSNIVVVSIQVQIYCCNDKKIIPSLLMCSSARICVCIFRISNEQSHPTHLSAFYEYTK